MKLEIDIIPHKENNFTWQQVLNYLDVQTFAYPISEQRHFHQLMDTGVEEVIKGSSQINHLGLYKIISVDDYNDDFYIHFFYDKALSSDADDAYDFLSYYDPRQRIQDLRSRAAQWDKLKYVINVEVQISCSTETIQCYFNYVWSLAKAFDGLIRIDEDAENIGQKIEKFGKLKFGLYTPKMFQQKMS